MEKKVKIKLFPTKDIDAPLFQIGDSLFIDSEKHDDRYGGRHIFLLSTEPFQYPPKGTAYYDGQGNLRTAGTGATYSLLSQNIVATTDKTVKITKLERGYTEYRSKVFYSENSFPSISKEFILHFITYKEDFLENYLYLKYENGYIDNKPVSGGVLVLDKENNVVIKELIDNLKKEDMFKPAYMIILPVKESRIALYDGMLVEKRSSSLNYKKDCVISPQSFYIYSIEDKLKEGDWCIQFDGSGNLYYPDEPIFRCDSKVNSICRYKIIATTESNLYTDRGYKFTNNIPSQGFTGFNIYIPQLPDAFLKNYILEYNEGNAIIKVEVEYSSQLGDDYKGVEFTEKELDYKIKVNLDNTICVKIKSDSIIANNLNREEIEEMKLIIKRFKNYAEINGYPSKSFKERVNKFVKEKL